MAIRQETMLPIFTDIDPNFKTVSIGILTIIYNNEIEIARTMDRRAFSPGQIDQVKAYIRAETSPEISYLDTIWDQPTIDKYNQATENATGR